MNLPIKANARSIENLSLRQDWEPLIQEALRVNGDETTDTKQPNAPLTDDSDWDW